MTEQFEKTEIDLTLEGLEDMRNDCLALNVIYQSAEDRLADTVKPRLEQAVAWI